MAQEFDARHMVVSRGRVYNRHTGRWLGAEADFAIGGVPGAASSDAPFGDDLSKKQLVEIAKEVSLPGYSALDKSELLAALTEIGAIKAGPLDVPDDEGDDGGEGESGPSESAEAPAPPE